LEPDKTPTIDELKKQRLTNGEEPVIIIVRANGLVCVPRGVILPTGQQQPVSQGIFRVSDGIAYAKSRFFKVEFPFGFADFEKDDNGQDFISVRIPVRIK